MDSPVSTPPLRARPRFPRPTLWILGAAWLTAVTAGFVSLFDYSVGPGAAVAPPARWPAEAPVVLDPARPTLLLFAHPQCPCTRATITELDRLMAHGRDRLVARVLFYDDPRLASRWERSKLAEHAARIPGVQPQADPLGATARLFGAETSGSAVLYAPDGRLLFHGGITASRGHEGDNAGAAAIVDLVGGEVAEVRTTAVYGCALVGPEPLKRAR
jgi:hypothetical protein